MQPENTIGNISDFRSMFYEDVYDGGLIKK
jgi:hypothetical protein